MNRRSGANGAREDDAQTDNALAVVGALFFFSIQICTAGNSLGHLLAQVAQKAICGAMVPNWHLRGRGELVNGRWCPFLVLVLQEVERLVQLVEFSVVFLLIRAMAWREVGRMRAIPNCFLRGSC
jgi:hypothetical protein